MGMEVELLSQNKGLSPATSCFSLVMHESQYLCERVHFVYLCTLRSPLSDAGRVEHR